jgi:hypothetical protein
MGFYHFVYFGHEANGFVERSDDLVVMAPPARNERRENATSGTRSVSLVGVLVTNLLPRASSYPAEN